MKKLSKERILSGGGNGFLEVLALVVRGRKMDSNKLVKGICWECGQSGHLKKDCKNRKEKEQGRQKAPKVTLAM